MQNKGTTTAVKTKLSSGATRTLTRYPHSTLPQQTQVGPVFSAGSHPRAPIGWLSIKATLSLPARLLESLPVG